MYRFRLLSWKTKTPLNGLLQKQNNRFLCYRFRSFWLNVKISTISFPKKNNVIASKSFDFIQVRRSSLIIERSLFSSLLKSNSIKKILWSKTKQLIFWRKYKITRREGSLPNLWQDIANFEIFFFCEILIFLFTVYFFGVFFVKRKAPDGRLFYCKVRKQISDNKTRHTCKIRQSIFEILEHQPTVI